MLDLVVLNDLSVVVFYLWNNFPISVSPLYVLVERKPEVAFISWY